MSHRHGWPTALDKAFILLILLGVLMLCPPASADFSSPDFYFKMLEATPRIETSFSKQSFNNEDHPLAR